jgi:hypothetical protein
MKARVRRRMREAQWLAPSPKAENPHPGTTECVAIHAAMKATWFEAWSPSGRGCATTPVDFAPGLRSASETGAATATSAGATATKRKLPSRA